MQDPSGQACYVFLPPTCLAACILFFWEVACSRWLVASRVASASSCVFACSSEDSCPASSVALVRRSLVAAPQQSLISP